MTFTQAIASGFKNYASFWGRASRSEFWFWQLFIFLGGIGAIVLDLIVPTQNNVVSGLFGLATMVPSLAVMVRRLHDINCSGWWLLFGLVPLVGVILLIVWWCSEGTHGYNRFGADPLPAQFSRHAAGRSLRHGRTDKAGSAAPHRAPR